MPGNKSADDIINRLTAELAQAGTPEVVEKDILRIVNGAGEPLQANAHHPDAAGLTLAHRIFELFHVVVVRFVSGLENQIGSAALGK